MTCNDHEGPCLCDRSDTDAAEITRRLVARGVLETTRDKTGHVSVHLTNTRASRGLF